MISIHRLVSAVGRKRTNEIALKIVPTTGNTRRSISHAASASHTSASEAVKMRLSPVKPDRSPTIGEESAASATAIPTEPRTTSERRSRRPMVTFASLREDS